MLQLAVLPLLGMLVGYFVTLFLIALAYVMHICSIQVFLSCLSLIGSRLYYVYVTLYLSCMFVSLILKFIGTR